MDCCHQPPRQVNRGYLPSASTQAAITTLAGSAVEQMAAHEARKGTDPELAARNALEVATAVAAYVLCVVLWYVVGTLAALAWVVPSVPLAWVWILGNTGFLYLLGLRLALRIQRPAHLTAVYALPTWALTLLGFVWAWASVPAAAVAYIIIATIQNG